MFKTTCSFCEGCFIKTSYHNPKCPLTGRREGKDEDTTLACLVKARPPVWTPVMLRVTTRQVDRWGYYNLQNIR